MFLSDVLICHLPWTAIANFNPRNSVSPAGGRSWLFPQNPLKFLFFDIPIRRLQTFADVTPQCETSIIYLFFLVGFHGEGVWVDMTEIHSFGFSYGVGYFPSFSFEVCRDGEIRNAGRL